jgi:surface carbohydrate biosynthesis protein (TIGR04326 family)
MSAINLNKDFHRLAIEEREGYLQFIHKFGNSRTRKLFNIPGEEFSLWWMSLIAEKSTVKSDVYEKLIALLVSGKPEPRSLRSRIKSSLLYKFYLFVRGIVDLLVHILRAFYIKVSVNDFQKRLRKLKACDYVIVTPFPLFDKQKSEAGTYENKFVPALHRSLEEVYRGRYAHICLHVDSEGLKLGDSVYWLNKFNRKQILFLLDEFFNLIYTPILFFYYLYFSVVFVFNVAKIRRQAFYEYKGRTYDLWPILANDFYYSFCGPNLVSSLWYIFAFKKACSSLEKGSKVISVCEMSWWEKALYIFARKQGLITVGYQHTRLPKLLLNYFNTGQDVIENGVFDPCPLPDYLATVGRTAASIFKDDGWPDTRIFVWGAQRFEPFRKKESFFVPWDKKESCFICAFSINEFETERVISFLAEAFREPLNYKILLKSHPNIDLKKLIARCSTSLYPANFEIVDEDITSLAKKSKGMIVTDSSSCFYALASSSPVIILRFKDRVDANPLSYISDLALYVYSPQELKDTCDKIITGCLAPVPHQSVVRFLDDYLYFPDKDEDYLEKIKNIQAGARLWKR